MTAKTALVMIKKILSIELSESAWPKYYIEKVEEYRKKTDSTVIHKSRHIHVGAEKFLTWISSSEIYG